MIHKTELVRSIRRQPDGTVRINLTVKDGESYILLDTMVVKEFKEIKAETRVHNINLIPRYIE